MVKTMMFRSCVAGLLVSMAGALYAAAPAAAKSGNGLALGVHEVQLGPRPFYLVKDMDAGPLKDKLASCENGPFFRSDFSIGHRGAAMQFPEHTRESY